MMHETPPVFHVSAVYNTHTHTHFCLSHFYMMFIVTGTFTDETENSGFRRLNHKSNCHNRRTTSLSPGPPHYPSTRQPAVGNRLGVSLSPEPGASLII